MQKRKGDDPNSFGSKQARLARETVERIMLNLQKANGEWAATNGAERKVCKSTAPRSPFSASL